MSTIWTPSGEYEPREEPGAAPAHDHGHDHGHDHAGAHPPHGPPGEPPDLSPEELEAVRRLHQELRTTPAVDVIANHAVQLFQLALVYLGVATPPDAEGRPPLADLANAGVVVDAMAALVDGLGERLGDHEGPLRDGLSQLQVLYVRIADAAAGEPGEPGQA